MLYLLVASTKITRGEARILKVLPILNRIFFLARLEVWGSTVFYTTISGVFGAFPSVFAKIRTRVSDATSTEAAHSYGICP